MAVAGEGMSPHPGSKNTKRSSYQYTASVMKPLPGKQPPSRAGFLVSFLVDARGGAMTGHRHWGMRVIIPPGALHQPTRVNCKYQDIKALASHPPLNEREALASRVIEISPAGEKFSAPVLLEIPHFASHARAERETVVLRSDDGITWREHISEPVEDGQIYQDVVESVVLDNSHLERIYDVLEVNRGRVVRILTSHFPKYFAVISRVREDSVTIGQEGGKVTLLQDTKLRATFSQNALNRPIKVGLQVQTLTPELVQAAFGRSVEVSKMVSVEPRARKFHQPIFISIPLPCAARNANNVRLLCSMTGEDKKAQWKDMTGTTPLEINQDVVHFSTKVSAIFWILVIYDKQRDPDSALSLASRLYEESILAPYMARISVFYRENFPRAWVTTLRIYCMTDDKAEKVISSLHGFQPLAFSGDIEITDTSTVGVKLKGNLLQLRQDPFNGEMLTTTTLRNPDIKGKFIFKAFEENSLTLLVKPKEVSTPIEGKMSFFRKLTAINDTQQLPICDLNFNAKEGALGEGNKIECQNSESGSVETLKSNHTPIHKSLEVLEPTDKKLEKYLEEDPYEIIERKTLADIHPQIEMENDVHTNVYTEEQKDVQETPKEKEPDAKDEILHREEIIPLDKALVEFTQLKEENDHSKVFEALKIEPMHKVDQHEHLLQDSIEDDKKTLQEFKKEFYVDGDGVANKSENPEEKLECETVNLSDTTIEHLEEQSGPESLTVNVQSLEIKPYSEVLDDNSTCIKELPKESSNQQNIPIKVQKEKKKSFIQEWRNDLKDFFTIKKKSKSKTPQESKKVDNMNQQECGHCRNYLEQHKAAMVEEPILTKEQSKETLSHSNIKSINEDSQDSTSKLSLDSDLESQQFSTSMVAHMLMPLEKKESCVEPEMNATNTSEKDKEFELAMPQEIKELEDIAQITSDLLHEETTETNLESEINQTNSTENEIEKGDNVSEENEKKLSDEKLENINDTELIQQHDLLNEAEDKSCFTTTMVTHCVIDNKEVMETQLSEYPINNNENAIENDQSKIESAPQPGEQNENQSFDWFKNKMLPLDEKNGKYTLPQETTGTKDNWISNWIVNEKEQPKKKENKSGFIKDVKKFFRPQKKSKMTNSNVSHSQTLQPSYNASSTKPNVAQSLPTTPEAPQKSSKLSTSQYTAPECDKKQGHQESLIQYDVQKVQPVSIVDDLISNMLQEPTPIQDDDIRTDLISQMDDQADGGKNMVEENICKEPQEDSLKSKRPSRTKRSSRRKTNDTVTPNRATEEVMDKTMANNEDNRVSMVETNGKGEDIESSPPPELRNTRRKKKRTTNEEIEKEQERNLLYPDEKKSKPVLKKQDSTSSCGEKPKVVVPAPRGIPRPRRRRKDGTLEPEHSRDCSVDSFTEKSIEGFITQRKSRQSSIVEIEEVNSVNGEKSSTKTSSDVKDSGNYNPFCENELLLNNKNFLDEFVDKSIDEAIKCSITMDGELHKSAKKLFVIEGIENIKGDTEETSQQYSSIQTCSAGEKIQSLEADSKILMDSEEFNRAADSFDELCLDDEKKDSSQEVTDENLELKSNLLGNITFSNKESGDDSLQVFDTPEDDQNCTIDPEYLKNIDGQAHQRKGFTRFQKRQNSRDKHKSPSHEEEENGAEEEDNTNLTTKLEETNVQMKRVEESFNILSDEDDDLEKVIITQTITTETVIEEPWIDQLESNEGINKTRITTGILTLAQSPLVQELESPTMVQELENSTMVQELEDTTMVQIQDTSPLVQASDSSSVVHALDSSSSKKRDGLKH